MSDFEHLLKYVLVGTILIIGFLIIDTLVDYFIFNFDTVFSPLSGFEVYFRVTVIIFIIVILVFSYILGKVGEKQHKELLKIDKLKSEFLRRISHELKTPLISIKGYANLMIELHNDKLDIEMAGIIEEISYGCFRLETLIKNLLDASKLKSSRVKVKATKEDLSFLIKFCIHEVESLTVRRSQSIKLDIYKQVFVYIEKEEIHTVLSNLLTNAIKYTPPMGKIEVKTELKNDSVVVSVSDNGIGFTEEQETQIFQQFGKIERYGQGLDLGIDGIGLGLFISKRIVESHGGKIWMESEGKNKGATFYFTLPFVK